MPSEGPRERRLDDGAGRPVDRESYLRWLKESLGAVVDGRLEARYGAVVNKVKRDFEESPLWTGIGAALVDFDSAYRMRSDGYLLFLAEPERPPLLTKSFDSYVLKTYRRNVLENERWPEPPAGGWIVPDEGFEAVNDLVRTAFVVKYLDGVEFLAERLRALAEEHGWSAQLDFEARMEGHYAAHLCFRDEFAIPGPSWDTEPASVAVEVQITTQLQEVIRRLTHRYYEARREQPVPARSSWQWNYESDEFTANYLGHILHYVEGMIMEVRARQRDETKGTSTWSEARRRSSASTWSGWAWGRT